ncbi:MAG: hypothetical protein WCK39_00100 [Methanomassiliicoccales archaeon]
MVMVNEPFLNKMVTEKTMRPILDAGVFWEQKLRVVPNAGLIRKYMKEQYIDFELPNDAATGRDAFVEPRGRAPAWRSEGGEFAHADISQPKEFFCRLYQLGLEIDYTEEEMMYSDRINQVTRKTQKLANFFVGYENSIVGNVLTESWAPSPSAIQHVAVSSGDEWGNGPADETVDPYKNILDAQEMIDDIDMYNYSANLLAISKQSFYDLKYIIGKRDYQYTMKDLSNDMAGIKISGVDIVPSAHIKRDFGVMADYNACGEIYEAAATSTHKYYTDKDHIWHLQMMRTWNAVVTDPKAIVLFTNLA